MCVCVCDCLGKLLRKVDGSSEALAEGMCVCVCVCVCGQIWVRYGSSLTQSDDNQLDLTHHGEPK